MLAYRVNLTGTHDHYLVTERQKPALDSALKENRGVVIIGGDTIRVSSIKSVTQVDVDLASCPAYFQVQVKREQEKVAAVNNGLMKMPTKWVILDLKGKILKEDVARSSIAEVAQAMLAIGDPEENKDLRFVVAKCHFKFGDVGEKQYFTATEQIPEALRCFPCSEDASHMVVRRITRYGIPE